MALFRDWLILLDLRKKFSFPCYEIQMLLLAWVRQVQKWDRGKRKNRRIFFAPCWLLLLLLGEFAAFDRAGRERRKKTVEDVSVRSSVRLCPIWIRAFRIPLRRWFLRKRFLFTRKKAVWNFFAIFKSRCSREKKIVSSIDPLQMQYVYSIYIGMVGRRSQAALEFPRRGIFPQLPAFPSWRLALASFRSCAPNEKMQTWDWKWVVERKLCSWTQLSPSFVRYE